MIVIVEVTEKTNETRAALWCVKSTSFKKAILAVVGELTCAGFNGGIEFSFKCTQAQGYIE